MIELFNSLISDNSRVLILGFGKEGRSTYNFLRAHFPELLLGIADINSEIRQEAELANDNKLELFLGSDYLDALKHFDIIIKSPGVKIGDIDRKLLDKINRKQKK